MNPRDPALTEQELDRLAQVLVRTLETFKVQGEIVGRTTGPVVTQYEFAPAPGIKVSRVEALDADLALALKAPSVRIVAPIPGKGAVGVEVPNPEPEVVYLRKIVEAPAFLRARGLLPAATEPQRVRDAPIDERLVGVDAAGPVVQTLAPLFPRLGLELRRAHFLGYLDLVLWQTRV